MGSSVPMRWWPLAILSRANQAERNQTMAFESALSELGAVLAATDANLSSSPVDGGTSQGAQPAGTRLRAKDVDKALLSNRRELSAGQLGRSSLRRASMPAVVFVDLARFWSHARPIP